MFDIGDDRIFGTKTNAAYDYKNNWLNYIYIFTHIHI